jgi:transposase
MQQAARERKVSVPSVSKWRQRFALWGVRGLCDRARPGKPVQYDAAFRNRVLALLEQIPPPGRSHGDGPAVAEKLGASVPAVWRVLRREGIYLRRRRKWVREYCLTLVFLIESVTGLMHKMLIIL